MDYMLLLILFPRCHTAQSSFHFLSHHRKVLLFRKLVTLDESIPVSKMTLPSAFQDVSAFRMSPFDPNR